jgi:hypothetical protein
MDTLNSNLSSGQFKGLSYDDLDTHLESEFHPQQLDAPRVKHPRSGFAVEAGISRRVARPPEGQQEGPAVFDVKDHGDPLTPAYNSLAYMGGKRLGQEPIQHVYRGMSGEEWNQARQRGFIQSDQRGTIADWEGTNADVDPRSAVSYLPMGERGHIAKIRVEPEDKWFTHRADSYVRTRKPIPLSRVEHVAAMEKDMKGHLRIPRREAMR